MNPKYILLEFRKSKHITSTTEFSLQKKYLYNLSIYLTENKIGILSSKFRTQAKQNGNTAYFHVYKR